MDRDRMHFVGEPIEFSGYAEDFDSGVSAIEFSLDDGRSWTAYSTAGSVSETGVNWRFAYTPQRPGRYLLKARAVSADGRASTLVSGFAFEVHPGGLRGHGDAFETYGSAAVRAVGGGPLRGARLFRSRDLSGIGDAEARFIVGELGVRTVYDMRSSWEVSAHPEPYLMGAKTVALEPAEQKRKDASKRLVHGVIGAYGAPEERMVSNYRKYVGDYPLIGTALRSIASSGENALVHCVNGKDRTGVLCAVMLRVAGFDRDAIMADYLATNEVNAASIEAEAAQLGVGMTAEEHAMLMSFLEARPAYLDAFFREAEERFGSFERYVREGLRVTPAQQASLREMLAR